MGLGGQGTKGAGRVSYCSHPLSEPSVVIITLPLYCGTCGYGGGGGGENAELRTGGRRHPSGTTDSANSRKGPQDKQQRAGQASRTTPAAAEGSQHEGGQARGNTEDSEGQPGTRGEARMVGGGPGTVGGVGGGRGARRPRETESETKLGGTRWHSNGEKQEHHQDTTGARRTEDQLLHAKGRSGTRGRDLTRDSVATAGG